MLAFAGIISLGDSNAYLLSTAEEHLGVIAARSATGQCSQLKARAFIITSLSRRKTGADLRLSNELSSNEYCWATQSSENPIGSCRRRHATELDLCFCLFSVDLFGEKVARAEMYQSMACPLPMHPRLFIGKTTNQESYRQELHFWS